MREVPMAQWLRGHSQKPRKRTYFETRHVPYPGLFSDRPVISETAIPQGPTQETNSSKTLSEPGVFPMHERNVSFSGPEAPVLRGTMRPVNASFRLGAVEGRSTVWKRASKVDFLLPTHPVEHCDPFQVS